MQKDKFKNLILDLLLLTILAFALTLISFLFVEPDMDRELFIKFINNKAIFKYNFLPILAFLYLLYFLTGRFWLAFFIGSTAIILMGVTNASKIFYREETFNMLDMTLIYEAMNMVDHDFAIQWPNWIWFAAGLILFISICYMLARNFKVRGWMRWIGLALSLAFAFFVFKVTTDNEIYAQTKVEGFSPWVDVENEKARGMIYSFMHSYNAISISKPDGYDEDFAKNAWEKYEDADIPADKKINIIAIMFESYNDFSKLGVDFNKYPYEAYDEIKDASISGSLIVHVFGGGTINTERTFLTGVYGQPRYNRKVNSYAWYLKSQGYNTVSMHPHLGVFYNRKNVNRYLGFDDFFYDENYFDEVWGKSYYMPDKELFKHILKDYKDNKKTGKPYFNMTVTMQNHGPYNADYNVPAYIKPDFSVDEKAIKETNVYFDGIKSSSEAFRDLLDKLKDDDEPVMVIAFGDHNPFLGQDDVGFEAMGVDVDPKTWRGYVNRYRTPYVIWANDKAKEVTRNEFVGEGPTLSPQYLMGYAFDQMGLEGPKTMQIKRNEFPDISVFNTSYTKKGSDLIPTVTDKIKPTMHKLLSVDYYTNTHFMYKEDK